MAKTLCDDGVTLAQGAAAAPEPATDPAPAPTVQEPTAQLTSTPTAPEPEPDPADEERALERLIADLNVGDTLALVTDGPYHRDAVLAAEQATKQRSTVIDALTPDDDDEQEQ